MEAPKLYAMRTRLNGDTQIVRNEDTIKRRHPKMDAVMTEE